MEGIPDSGSVFSSWQPVNVFTLFEVVWDASGNQYTNTSSVAALIPEYVETSVLTFTVQPGQVLLDNPGVTMLTESRGWQANFVAVPEPSSIALIVWPGRHGIFLAKAIAGGQSQKDPVKLKSRKGTPRNPLLPFASRNCDGKSGKQNPAAF